MNISFYSSSFFFSQEKKGNWSCVCTYLDSDVDADALVLLPLVRSVIPLLGGVVAHDEGILGELFVEALGSASIDVEVEGLRRSHKGCERK